MFVKAVEACQNERNAVLEIWEFPNDSESTSVVTKHYGMHSCSPLKPKRETQFAKEIKSSNLKACFVKRNILSSLVKEGAEMNVIEGNASKLLNRTVLNKIKKDSKNTDFSKLLELKDKYQKNDTFFIFRMNDRRLNSNLTYVFKTSMTAFQIACEMNINSDHFMGHQYAHFDGSEKRISKMTVLTLSVYYPLLRKQIPLATMDCESENKETAELFWKMWIEALKEFNGEIKFDPIGIILDEKT